jgi:hypothetical protein
MQITANDTGGPAVKTAGSGYVRGVISERERKRDEKNIKSVSEGSRRVERPATSPDITSDCDVVRCNKASGRCLSGSQRELISKLQAQVWRPTDQFKFR